MTTRAEHIEIAARAAFDAWKEASVNAGLSVIRRKMAELGGAINLPADPAPNLKTEE